jgi:hypothetical protein
MTRQRAPRPITCRPLALRRAPRPAIARTSCPSFASTNAGSEVVVMNVDVSRLADPGCGQVWTARSPVRRAPVGLTKEERADTAGVVYEQLPGCSVVRGAMQWQCTGTRALRSKCSNWTWGAARPGRISDQPPRAPHTAWLCQSSCLTRRVQDAPFSRLEPSMPRSSAAQLSWHRPC